MKVWSNDLDSHCNSPNCLFPNVINREKWQKLMKLYTAQLRLMGAFESKGQPTKELGLMCAKKGTM